MKALAMLSGGLDSTLAVRIILEQGIDVEAVNFTSPFCLCNREGRCEAAEIAQKFKIPLHMISKGEEYVQIIRNPKYGYGKNMNPCIDCRIFMLKKAKALAKRIGASFIFTGEVLDQRPMSQHWYALKIIEKEARLEGKILRPLSAKFLPKTEAERKGWVDRRRLLGFKGRTRKKQIELAKNLGITDYRCPAGGCLLTYREFAAKVKDLFNYRRRVSMKDMVLLKFGRHFRFGQNKIIVGRNQFENNWLKNLKDKHDYIFEVPSFGSPITILQGPKTEKAIRMAALLTARYCDADGDKVLVNYSKDKLDSQLTVPINLRECGGSHIQIGGRAEGLINLGVNMDGR